MKPYTALFSITSVVYNKSAIYGIFGIELVMC